MRKLTDLSGQRFGKLTVIRFHETRNKHPYYLCKCDCGNETIVRGGALKQGETTSCGCTLKKSREDFGKRVQKHYVLDGVDYSREAFCEKIKMSSMTFYRRIQSGKTIEEIVAEQRAKGLIR